MPTGPLGSDLLRYIIDRQLQPGERLPTITELSAELGVSVGKLREELEVARTLGLVQVKPRTGSQVRAFDFAPAATLSVLYAIGLNPTYFHTFGDLRKHLELSYWTEAVACLTEDDIATLRGLLERASEKLNQLPIEVPVEEHVRLHLTFFRHLDNPFVQGLLSAYWAAYKAFGVALHAPLAYHREVWAYHAQMVDCVARGDFEGGRRALQEHMELLKHSPDAVEPKPRWDDGATKPYSYLFSIFE